MQNNSQRGKCVPARPSRRAHYPDLSFMASARPGRMHRPNRNDLPLEQLGWNLLDENGDFIFPETKGDH